MTIAVTGHRPNKIGNDYSLEFKHYGPLKQAIYRELELMVSYLKPKALITGMAQGVDQIFATVALRLDIPFIAVCPCVGQEKPWPLTAQLYYNKLLEQASVVKYVSPVYTPECMQLRNKVMVDACDLLIGVWDGTPGGTANAIKYAMSIGKNMRTIDLNELREIIKTQV